MNLTPQELEDKLAKYRGECAKYGDKWALAKAEYSALDMRKHDVLADITQRQEGKSNAEKERNARLTDEWKLFQDGRADAEAKALELKVKYDVARISWETCKVMIFMRINEAKGLI